MTIYKRALFQRLFVSPSMKQEDKDLFRSLTEQDDNLAAILDRGVSFLDNVDCDFVTYTSNAVADTEDTVAHDLGKVPTGIIPVSLDKAGIIYKSTTYTDENLFLKCNVASVTATLLVF